MKINPIKIINILIIVFAFVSICLCINLMVSANNTYSMFVNDEGADNIIETLKDDTSSNLSSSDISRYEQLLNSNGYNLSDAVQMYTDAAIGLITGLLAFGLLLNILVIIFAIVVYRRSTNETLIFFTTKFAVFILIISVLTLNVFNVILSIISIVCIRKKMF